MQLHGLIIGHVVHQHDPAADEQRQQTGRRINIGTVDRVPSIGQVTSA